MGMMFDNGCCCKGCTERKVTLNYNCHSHCEKFKAWKKIDQARYKRQKEFSKLRGIDLNCASKW